MNNFETKKEELLKNKKMFFEFKNGYERVEFENFLNSQRIFYYRKISNCNSAFYNIIDY